MHLLKKTTEILSVFLIFTMLILTCGCAASQKRETITISSAADFEGRAKECRVYNNITAEVVAQTDSAQLLFHEKSGGIALKSLNTGKVWSSLPLFDNTFAASFIACVFYGDKLYYLDSSSCAAADGSIEYEKTADGAVITYNMDAQGISLSLPVSLSLSGAYLDVSIDMEKVTASEGAVLTSVQMLPFMGSIRYSEEASDYSAFGDYYLLPDGAGALMYTAIEDDKKELTFSVYGKDYYEESIPSYVAAYGIQQNGSALCATVTKGDENALIRVFRAGADGNNINRIYPEFIITPLSGTEGKVTVGTPYQGKITVSYGVLSETGTDYIDMATTVRQALIRGGFIPAHKCENEYPFSLSLVVSVDGAKSNTGTTYQQAENLLGILKGKGINEINLVLSGVFDKGLASSAENDSSLVSAAGKRADIENLLSYAASQRMNVFAETNLLSSASFVNAVKGASGEYQVQELTNPLSPYVGKEYFTLKKLSAGGVSRGTNKLLALLDRYAFSGIALSDTDSAGLLISGYGDAVNGNLSALASGGLVMMSGAGMNLIKNADYLYNVQLGNLTEISGAYVTVPFVPALLHGSVVYSGKPVNLGFVSTIDVLKNIEYGAVPRYVWTFDGRSDKYYENGLTDAVELYLRASDDFSDLASKRITDHFLYEDGVYCTGYEGGTRVYVNYNNYSVIIGEVSVMPYDYLRIG